MTDAEAYARLKPPTSIVVKFGSAAMIGEYPYDGDAKPGCGSKLVVRTHRGTELAEMLTTTCPNSGCSKSVSRRDMLEYIDNSGGKDYPFHTNGRVLRVATVEDLARWSGMRDRYRRAELDAVREKSRGMGFTMKIVEVEPVLGGEHVVVHYLSEDRVDFRELVPALARHFGARVEMHQIGARDEARLVADYEKCGQHCCCTNFLKVLKPVSMKSAKTQKASLDPLKISGRCGRLMCCLRYEDETYDELKKKLPKLKSRVGTAEGTGIVVDTKILVQLALVRLEADGREIAVPVAELLPPDAAPPAAPDPLRGANPDAVARRVGGAGARGSGAPANRPAPKPPAKPSGDRAPAPGTPAAKPTTPPPVSGTPAPAPGAAPANEGAAPRRKRRRRRGKGGQGGGPGAPGQPPIGG